MTYYSRVTEDGDVVVPASLVIGLGLKPGEDIAFDRTGNEIVLKTFTEVVREGQQAFRATIKRPFTVDEFLADRRSEADD